MVLVRAYVVDACYQIHTRLGPGLLESVYESVLYYELSKRGLHADRQIAIPIVLDQLRFDEGFRADLIIDDKVILELKSVEQTAPVQTPHQRRYHPIGESARRLVACFSVVE